MEGKSQTSFFSLPRVWSGKQSWRSNPVAGGVNYERQNWRVETPGGEGEGEGDGGGMTMVFLKRSETGKRWLNNEKSHEWKRVTNKKRVCTRCTLWTNFKSAHVWVFIKKGKIKRREGERGEGGGGGREEWK